MDSRSDSSLAASISPMPSYLPGMTMSTPYGWSPTCSSIQSSSTASCSGVNPTAPRTPKPPALETAATTSRQWVKAKIGNSMPSSSQIGVRMSGLLGPGSSGGEADGHRLDAVDEVGVQAGVGPVQLDVRQAFDHLAHGRLDLGPGQAGAEAVVLAAAAERHVLVGRPADVEGVVVREHVLVPVGRRVVDDDLVALGDRHTPQLGVLRG